MKVKPDEENFDEALSQAYRAWTSTTVPSEIAVLFEETALKNLTPSSSTFLYMLSALQQFALRPPYTLPLSSTLPDMKSDTKNYIHLQKLYKARAEEEKAMFRSLLSVPVAENELDLFVKNSHGLRLLKGSRWGALDEDQPALGENDPVHREYSF